MSYREFQTAAARVVHLEHTSDRDVEHLSTEFHFHPLDVQALLGVSAKPRIGAYRDYVVASLPWPMLDRRGRHLVLTEIQFFVGPKYLVVADDGLHPEIQERLSAWTVESVNADAPVMLMYELLMQLLKETSQAARAVPAAEWSAAIEPLVDGVNQLRQRLDDNGWLQNQDQRNAIAMLSFRLKHLASNVANRPAPAAVRPLKQPKLQGAVAGYAIASAVMTVVVLLILSFQR